MPKITITDTVGVPIVTVTDGVVNISEISPDEAFTITMTNINGISESYDFVGEKSTRKRKR